MDIFRGLLMVCVVVGHTPTTLNGFIYHFHVATFFLLSGILFRIKKGGLRSFLINRTRRLLLTFFLIGLFFELLAKVINAIIPGDFFETVGLFGLLSLSTNPLAGATWFLPCLYFATLIVTPIYIAAIEFRNGIYLFPILISGMVGLFAAADGFHYAHHVLLWNLDLSVLAAAFMLLGILIRELNVRYLQEIDLLSAVAAIAILLLVVRFTPMNVNWPTRYFSPAAAMVCCTIAGSAFLYMIASMLERFDLKLLMRFLSNIGSSSIEILNLHFLCFKVAYVILFVSGFVSSNQIRKLVLEERTDLWWFVATIGVVLPMIVARALRNKYWVGWALWGRSR